MLNYKGFILLLVLSLYSLQSQAQAHAQAAMRVHMQAVRTHEQMNRQFRDTQLFMMSSKNPQKSSEKYKFNIVNLNGDTITARKKVKIQFTEPIKELTVKTEMGKEVYIPKQTKEIFTKKSNRNIVGVPYDGYWAFNTHSTDNLKLYAPFPETEINYVTLYQVKGDSIRPINTEAVEKLIQGNTKAEKALKKKKIHKALYIYLMDEKKKEKDKLKLTTTQS